MSRRTSTQARVMARARELGVDVEDLTGQVNLEFSITSPPGVGLVAGLGPHSAVVCIPRHEGWTKAEGWGSVMEDLDLGIEDPCTEPDCGMCERGEANI